MKKIFGLIFDKIKKREFYIKEDPSLSIAYNDSILKQTQALDPYQIWITENEPLLNEIEKMRGVSFNYCPLVSIIMPVFNPPSKIFKETISSVLEQTYPRWELCIVNGSTSPEIGQEIDAITLSDPRIKSKHLRNKGICGNTNEALSISTGEFIVFLDHDDLLSPVALFEVVKALNEKMSLDVIYSDSDKITEYGKRYEPFFKPDWSPELMICCNYMTHLCVIRKRLLDLVGPFEQETEGAQDWDIILKVTEKTQKIHHIQKILYHWRTIAGSAASDAGAKPYALNAQIVAVTNHLRRRNLNGYVIHGESSYLEFKMNFLYPKVSIIIPEIVQQSISIKNLNHYLDLLEKNTAYPDFEIIVVTNSDVPVSPSARIKTIRIDSADIWELLNAGAKKASGEVLVFFDRRLEIGGRDWLKELAGWAMVDEIGCVGSKILNRGGIIQHGGIIIGADGTLHSLFGNMKNNPTMWTPFGSQEWYRNLNAVWGCLAIRKDLFSKLGGFGKAGKNFDIELCLKVRSHGYRILYNPHSRLFLEEDTWSGLKVSLDHKSHLVPDAYYTLNLAESSVTTLKRAS